MANFCTKCGSAVDAGAQFCTKCGNALAAAPAYQPAPAPVSAPAPAYQPPAAIGTAPPTSSAGSAKNSSAVKIILIVLGIFVGMGILAGAAVIFGIWGISRAVKVDESGDKMSISTPLGNMTMDQAPVAEAELGIPIYPGAEGEQGNLRLGNSQGSMDTFVFKTPDSPEQVVDFYRSKLPEKTDYMVTEQGGVITSSPDDGVGYMITVGRDDSKGNTVISVMRGLSAKSQ